MDWLNHPRFKSERARVIDLLRSDKYDFRRIKKVVFLCGGQGSQNRDNLSEYLKRYSHDTLVFYAESVWLVIESASPGANALAIEEKLAALADIVMIIVESPGTFAEIGAFAMSEPLRSKLLPILDIRYMDGNSFIKTGPVRWVDADSHFKPSIWTGFDHILTATDQIEERLSRLQKSVPAKITNITLSPKLGLDDILLAAALDMLLMLDEKLVALWAQGTMTVPQAAGTRLDLCSWILGFGLQVRVKDPKKG